MGVQDPKIAFFGFTPQIYTRWVTGLLGVVKVGASYHETGTLLRLLPRYAV